jgi:hypothetical protein
MPRLQHVRVQAGSSPLDPLQGWQLVRKSRKSDLYARLINTDMAVNAGSAGPVGPVGLDDPLIHELTNLLGTSFQLGAQEVKTAQEANYLVQAVAKAAAQEEDAMDALSSKLGSTTIKNSMSGGKKRNTRMKKRKQRKTLRRH